MTFRRDVSGFYFVALCVWIASSAGGPAAVQGTLLLDPVQGTLLLDPHPPSSSVPS